jgi:hypothetical protein
VSDHNRCLKIALAAEATLTDAELWTWAIDPKFAPDRRTYDLARELLAARRALRDEYTDADRDARMRTLSGWLHPLAPRPGEIQIRDIAAGLAATYRYRGQTGGGLYTVAEHSVLVSEHVDPRFAKQALLHDAAEAYLADIVGPIKGTTPFRGFRQLEETLSAAIYAAFGVVTTEESDVAVHSIDKRMCSDEMPLLLRPALGVRPYDDRQREHVEHIANARAKYGEPVGAEIKGCEPGHAEDMFLARYRMLWFAP